MAELEPQLQPNNHWQTQEAHIRQLANSNCPSHRRPLPALPHTDTTTVEL